MNNASLFWPTCDATPANCNGNNDGSITFNFTASTNESYRAWQHLLLAGIMQGAFTGIGGPPSYQANIGTSVASSKYDNNAGYFFDNLTNYPVSITLAGFIPTIECNLSLLPPKDVYNIDMKVDDGIPNTGIIISSGGYVVGNVGVWDTNCVSGSNYLNLNSDVRHCRLQYIYKK
jgi:hypothetical protein